MYGVEPTYFPVIIRQAGTKASGLHADYGVGTGVVVGFAVEYFEANQILLNGISRALKGLAHDEIQKTAMAGGLSEEGRSQDSS